MRQVLLLVRLFQHRLLKDHWLQLTGRLCADRFKHFTLRRHSHIGYVISAHGVDVGQCCPLHRPSQILFDVSEKL